ncbi:hypothetical protein KJ632_02505, partial [Patescibacteria group bacterium]|nr:hypothetical protein [Patescibacteria group bacterium]
LDYIKLEKDRIPNKMSELLLDYEKKKSCLLVEIPLEETQKWSLSFETDFDNSFFQDADETHTRKPPATATAKLLRKQFLDKLRVEIEEILMGEVKKLGYSRFVDDKGEKYSVNPVCRFEQSNVIKIFLCLG